MAGRVRAAHTGAHEYYRRRGVLRPALPGYKLNAGSEHLGHLPAGPAPKANEATMQHQPITDALTTEELVLSLECVAAEEPKMGPIGLLRVAAQAALAMGLCGAVNFIAG